MQLLETISIKITRLTYCAAFITRNFLNMETLSCTLTSPELKLRKTTVLAYLKQQVLEKTALPNGYVFQFSGSNAMLDTLVEFIKTERASCSFFSFRLTAGSADGFSTLRITGPDGAKQFIEEELGL